MNLFNLNIIVIVTCVIANGIGDERPSDYYENYYDKKIPIELSSDFPISRTITSIDILRIKKSRLVSSRGTSLSSMTNELRPMDWQLFDFYLFERIELSKDINSYVICAFKKNTENESYAYLVNIKEGYLKSIALISYNYHLSHISGSSENYGSLYSTINSGLLSLYESVYRTDDIFNGTVEDLPWYVAFRLWLHNIFSRSKNDYTKVLSLTLDENGLIHEVL